MSFDLSRHRNLASPELSCPRILECFGVFISLRKFRYAAPESSLESEPVRNYPGEKGGTGGRSLREEGKEAVFIKNSYSKYVRNSSS